jgi:Kdo2-lipid IVA lauroyltransferase/acyltransferase
MNKKIKSKIEFILFRLFYGLFRFFPYRVSEWFLKHLFLFGGIILGIRRQVAEQNVQYILPNLPAKDRRQLLKKMYYFMGKTIAEIYFGKPKKLEENLTIRGWENLEEAVALKKGVILATCHSGNWEFAGKYIAKHFAMAVIYKKLRNPFFDKFTNDLRLQANIGIIHSRKALKQIFTYLKKNYIITILVDQDAGKNGIITDFLGKPASTFPGTARIALKTGVPIVPAIALRDENENNKLIFEKMILPGKFVNQKDAVKDLTEHTSRILEKHILQNPEHWFWVHRRWKGAHKVRKKKEKQNDRTT